MGMSFNISHFFCIPRQFSIFKAMMLLLKQGRIFDFFFLFFLLKGVREARHQRWQRITITYSYALSLSQAFHAPDKEAFTVIFRMKVTITWLSTSNNVLFTQLQVHIHIHLETLGCLQVNYLETKRLSGIMQTQQQTQTMEKSRGHLIGAKFRYMGWQTEHQR